MHDHSVAVNLHVLGILYEDLLVPRPTRVSCAIADTVVILDRGRVADLVRMPIQELLTTILPSYVTLMQSHVGPQTAHPCCRANNYSDIVSPLTAANFAPPDSPSYQKCIVELNDISLPSTRIPTSGMPGPNAAPPRPFIPL